MSFRTISETDDLAMASNNDIPTNTEENQPSYASRPGWPNANSASNSNLWSCFKTTASTLSQDISTVHCRSSSFQSVASEAQRHECHSHGMTPVTMQSHTKLLTTLCSTELDIQPDIVSSKRRIHTTTGRIQPLQGFLLQIEWVKKNWLALLNNCVDHQTQLHVREFI